MTEIQQCAEKAQKYEASAEAADRKAQTDRFKAAEQYHLGVKVHKCAPAEFAKLVGKSAVHVRTMVKVWERYGDPASRIEGWTFAQHYQESHAPGRADKYGERWGGTGGRIENLSDADSTTLEKYATEKAAKDPAFAAKVTGAALGSKHGDKVAETVVKQNPKAAANIARGSNKVERDTMKAHERSVRARSEASWRTGKMLEGLGRMSKARYQLATALDVFRELGALNEDERDEAKQTFEALAVVMGWLDSFINTSDLSFEAGLAKLLSEGSE